MPTDHDPTVPSAPPPEPDGTAARLTALELAVDALGQEVRTRRLVVVDGDGQDRVVGEVVGRAAELRVELPGTAPGTRSTVLLHASSADPRDEAENTTFGPTIGCQLWGEGEAVVEIDAWPGADGNWQPHVHLGDAS